MSRILVTGAAGFIGSHLCERLVAGGRQVVGLDNFDEFYAPSVKWRNLRRLLESERFELVEGDIRDAGALDGLPDVSMIVHLAARAGVRPSIEQPMLYQDVNVTGTQQLLELCRRRGITQFVFGSSSSVYGNNEKVPFAESDPVDHPISPYAATKRAGELLCHTYRHLFGIGSVCLRFFTVYGPRQRPDLAIHKFTRLLLEDQAIPQFGDGSTQRDYTHIDDILQGVEASMEWLASNPAAFEIVNLGESRTVELSRLIELLSESLGITPRIERLPGQPGDVDRTYADISKARSLFGYDPRMPIERGIPEFVDWYRGVFVGG